MLINTINGPTDESKLTKVVKKEPVPCGDCVTTQYFLDGKLVRQDIEILVSESLVSQGKVQLLDTNK